jgi:hypothetical protein
MKSPSKKRKPTDLEIAHEAARSIVRDYKQRYGSDPEVLYDSEKWLQDRIEAAIRRVMRRQKP